MPRVLAAYKTALKFLPVASEPRETEVKPSLLIAPANPPEAADRSKWVTGARCSTQAAEAAACAEQRMSEDGFSQLW